MIYISHRGNINGKDEKKENTKEYILNALSYGYDVEVDVWYKDDRWFLGHDEPIHEIQINFLKQKKLWCHAKNFSSLRLMIKNDIHCFWHEEDKVTLTSQNYLWAFPGMQPMEGSIAVMPEINDEDVSKCIGICSDYIERYKIKKYEK
jgi:hypothetical protein